MRVFKLIAEKFGGHYYISVFSSPAWNQTFAKLGELTMDEKDYASFKEALNSQVACLIDKSAEAQQNDGK